MTQKLLDYVARPDDEFDILQSGVKGMRWGVRKDDSSGTTTAVASTGEPRQVVGAASGESSPERYARLSTQAKGGGAKDFSEQDLKFFNARTEALSKIAKMNEKKPGFLEESIRKVAKQTFQNALQTAATAGANKLLENTLGITPKGKIKGKDKGGDALKDAAAKIATAATAKPTAPLIPAVKQSALLVTTAKGVLATREATKTAKFGPVVQNDLFIDLIGSLRK